VPRPSRFVIPLLLLVLLASACTTTGEPDPQSSPDSTTTTETKTETSTTIASSSTGAAPTSADEGVDPDAKVITIGLLSDLTGPFAVAASDIIAGQSTYWDTVNASGGIDGWTVSYVVEDTGYNVEQHVAAYEQIRDDVVAIGLSTGSPHNVAALGAFLEDEILVVPLSWYSGWSFPSVDGGLFLELNTNYCLEAMNVLDFVSGMGGEKVALATFAGHYGQDAAAGVKAAVEFYGLSLVYDGESALAPGEPTTDVIQAIVESGADWTFLATNPSATAEIVETAVLAGYEGNFTGSYPSYDFRLLDLSAGAIVGDRFYQSAYHVPWGSEEPGNVEMMRALREAFPDRRPSDGLIVGWNQAIAMRRVIETAIANDDLTRRGFVAAAISLAGIAFGGSSPDQDYVGTPNEFVQRASAILKPDLAAYTSAGGASQTLSMDGATTGSIILEDFFVGEAAASHEFNRPCFG
jgi:ABC-type branched-subunit amino acid transport system substrate-binding protein